MVKLLDDAADPSGMHPGFHGDQAVLQLSKVFSNPPGCFRYCGAVQDFSLGIQHAKIMFPISHIHSDGVTFFHVRSPFLHLECVCLLSVKIIPARKGDRTLLLTAFSSYLRRDMMFGNPRRQRLCRSGNQSCSSSSSETRRTSSTVVMPARTFFHPSSRRVWSPCLRASRLMSPAAARSMISGRMWSSTMRIS